MSRPLLTLRALYFVIFGFLGGFGNYLPLWLEHYGWTETQMGWLGAVRSGCLILAPLFWGHMADRDGHSRRVLWITALGGVVAFAPMVVTAGLEWVVLSTTLFHLFREGTVPAADTAALDLIEIEGGTFGDNRIWGSFGFIAGGFLIAGVVAIAGRAAIPVALMVLLVVTVVLVSRLPAATARPVARGPLLKGVLTGAVVRFFGVLLLWRIAMQGFYQFLPLHLSALGVPDAWVPAYWAVGVLVEVWLFRNAERIFGPWPSRRVFLLCLVACVIQTGLAAVVTNPWLFLGVMALHGLSFGMAFYTTVVWLGALVPRERRATIQALLYAVAFGVGGAISSAASGYVYAHGAGFSLFLAEAVLSLVTLGVAALVLVDSTTFGAASSLGRG